MYRNLIFSILIIKSVIATAQYKPISYETTAPLSLIQIDNREFSTLLFFEYTVPNDSNWRDLHEWINISDKAHLTFPGTNKQYKLLSTVNMPIDSEAEHKYMVFDNECQKHRFVLEFDKLPDDVTNFDLHEGIESPTAFIINKINYNISDSLPYINVDNFIANSPLKEYGQYYVNGHTVNYIKYNGIIVNASSNVIDQYGKYLNISICVQNFRNRSILFNPENLSAIGYRHPKINKKNSTKPKQYIDEKIQYIERSVRKEKYDPNQYDYSIIIPFEAELLSYEEYDKIVKKKQKWESFWAALGEGLAAAGAGYSTSSTSYYGSSFTDASAIAHTNIGGIYGYAKAYGSSYTSSHGLIRTTSYNGLAAYAANQQAANNIAQLSYAQAQIRKQIGDGYVKKHTIPAETEYSGFFNIKYVKNLQGLSFTLIIDGQPYTFYF